MSLAIVVSNVASLKLHPSMDSETADEVLHGMVIKVLDRANGEWYQAQTRYGYEGYIHRSDIELDQGLVSNWQKRDYIVWKLVADVMAEPKYASHVVTTLTRGSIVKRTGTIEDKWERIGLADGSFGWIRAGFCRQLDIIPLAQENQLRAQIVNTALDYLGTQYRWGGKSPLGIDCSGLSSMAYMLNGHIIPRDANVQEDYLRKIDRNEAKPGDLFFFPGHVAICIGGGRYVHATGREGYVLINSLNNGDEDYREDLDRKLTGTGTIFGMEV